MATKKKLASRYYQIIVAIVTATLSLTCLLIVLSSGTGSAQGGVGWLSFAVIDCSKLETKVQNGSFRGLPDANDFSKHKDFYALYLWTYCSGHVAEGGSDFVADFCAKPGRKSLYNLYRYWNVWGSQVHKDGTQFYWLERGPDGLYIAYLASVALIVATVAVAQRALFTSRVTRLMLFLSALSFAATLATATVVQFTYGQLITRTGEPDMRTTSGKHGQAVYALTWTAVGLALASLGIWSSLNGGNPIRRAPTLDTKQLHRRGEIGVTSAIDSPILDRGMVATPVRKRTLISTMRF